MKVMCRYCGAKAFDPYRGLCVSSPHKNHEWTPIYEGLDQGVGGAGKRKDEEDRRISYEQLRLAEQQNAIMAEQAQEQLELQRRAIRVQEEAVRVQAETIRKQNALEQAKARMAAAATRHVMNFKATCPVCGIGNQVQLPNDGEVNFDCQKCHANMTVAYTGRVVVYDGRGKALSPSQLSRSKMSRGVQMPIERAVKCPKCSTAINVDWLPLRESYQIQCPQCKMAFEVGFWDSEERK